MKSATCLFDRWLFLWLFFRNIYIVEYDIVILGDNMKKNITSLKLQKETRDVLASVGSKGQTYDDIIRMLLQAYDESITFDDYK